MLESFLDSTVKMATPLLLAALGELLVEQAGIINIGIEGVMLTAAFFALVAAYVSGSMIVGFVAGIAAASIASAIFAVLAVNLAVNQVVAGTGLNIFALGLTGVFYRRIFGITGKAVTIRPLPTLDLSSLNRIPILGQALFDQNLLVYVAAVLVPATAWIFARTRY